jgi:hypothetical protein
MAIFSLPTTSCATRPAKVNQAASAATESTDPGDHDYFGGLIPVGVADIGAHGMPIDGDFNADGNVDVADYIVGASTTALRPASTSGGHTTT